MLDVVLRRIELSNFMSHTHTVIEPSPGLTVLVGPNNCGKSAVVVALQILANNDNSTYVMRHGTRESRVTVETDDDHTVEWARKRSGGPAYVVDGQRFDRLRNSVPEQVRSALRIGPVTTGTDGAAEFDLHFGSQKSPVFLLDQSGATVAQFFASSSDAEKLVRMQQLHREKVKRARQEVERLDGESERIERELGALTDAEALARRAEKAEADYHAVTQLRERIAAVARALGALSRESTAAEAATRRGEALASLDPPPTLHDTAALLRAIETLREQRRRGAAARRRESALSVLSAPPALADPQPLQTALEALQHARRQHQESLQRESQATAALAEAQAAVELWVKDQGRCPYCGGELRVDQVLGAPPEESSGDA